MFEFWLVSNFRWFKTFILTYYEKQHKNTNIPTKVSNPKDLVVLFVDYIGAPADKLW